MSEINIERDVRMALGDLTLQLIAARAEVQSLKDQLATAEPPAKPNGKGKPNEPASNAQPN